MKKAILILTAAFCSFFMYSQDITGDWNGILKVQGTQMRLVFHITKTDSGYLSTMDSPDQKAFEIPVTSTKFENSILKIEVANLKIEYSGELDAAHKIVGTFKQAGMVLPMDLSKEKVEKEIIIRKQEPTKPYPYYTEEVKFKNINDNITLAGTLTLPAKEGVFPVVILITGSGPQNRDEEIMGHKPFLIIADHLTRNGIAVLRYDDRGTAESEGKFGFATTQDFATDVMAAINYLKTRKEINKKQIGLIGHSEGGIIAPMVAAKSKDVNFIVLLAGTGIRGNELLLLQQELIGRAEGASEEELKKAKETNTAAFDIILNNDNAELIKSKLTEFMTQVVKDLPESEKPQGTKEADLVKQQVAQITSPWMLYFIKYNPSLVLKDVKCSVLALNGDKDLQVPSKVNLEAIKNGLQKGGNKNVTTKELPGLNHLFQECTTGSPTEYANIEQTFSPIALNEISDWIVKILKIRK